MPFYEYQCESCGRKFETFARTMNAASPPCPDCGGGKVVRRMSVFGVGAAAAKPAASSGCGSCAQSGSCPMAGRT